MANKMLIDATHPEETRVVVLRGSRVEEFDFESASKRQLRGNIYLAKVIRVEPSLQAAFVDYGGNRHGFLAFSEIHPDYYQIPVSDRQALLEEEAREEHDEEDERRPRRSRRRRSDRNQVMAHRSNDEVVSERLGMPEGEGAEDSQAASEEGPLAERQDGSGDAYQDPTGDLLRHADEIHETGSPATASVGEAATELGSEPAEAAEGSMEAHDGAAEGGDAVAASQDAPEPTDVPADENAVVANPVHAETVTSVAEAPPAPAITSDADVDTGSTTAPAAPEQADASLAGDLAPVAAPAHQPDHHETELHESERPEAERPEAERHGADHHDANGAEADHHEEEEHVDQIGGDAMEEIPHRAYRPRRQYKIQEVIKRRQVLLVQVVKEERGNKGAALTTYLSLAGRYSVLMPNTARGGGISRKITDATDRQRLKSIAQDLEVPEGMGVILRTAGASRTKPEVKRDFEYLMRMWETVRETTLASTAPTLVYEEGSLIKRAIRDLYNKEVEEVVVSGEGGYREAKDFMRLLMPSHAKNVQLWRDPAPLFTKAGAEAQLDAMFSNHVTLKSGGYLVINQTEALVAIDVNSGRSTREHNIEDTALRTNLEAADEVARQLRLRDLAGLIVVDFIDMEEMRNNRSVERRLKDALKDDRARIQVGRISHFGLLEMSRQRIRTGVLEGSTEVCPHCAGAGTVRSTASIALHVLRLLEDALLADASRDIVVRTRSVVALYILNQKRAHVSDLEARFGAAVAFDSDETLTGTTYCGLERGEPATGIITAPQRPAAVVEEPEIELGEVIEVEGEAEALPGEPANEDAPANRRRRRRRGRGRDREASGIHEDAPQPADDALAMLGDAVDLPADAAGETPLPEQPEADGQDDQNATDEGRSRRRRSRRGGRRTRDARPREEDVDGTGQVAEVGGIADLVTPASGDAAVAQSVGAEPGSESDAPAVATAPVAVADHDLASESHEVAPVPAPNPEMAVPVAQAAVDETLPGDDEAGEANGRSRRPEPVSSELDPSRPKRSGWWQRAKATITG